MHSERPDTSKDAIRASASTSAVRTLSNQLKESDGCDGVVDAKKDSNSARGGGSIGGTPVACGNKLQIYSIMRLYSERNESRERGEADGHHPDSVRLNLRGDQREAGQKGKRADHTQMR